MKIFLIVLAVLVLLIWVMLSLRVSIRLVYNEEFKYVLKAGPITLNKIIEGSGKKKKKSKKKKTHIAEDTPKEKKPIGETVGLITDIVKAFCSKFFGHVRVKLTRFIIRVATDDPAKTAISYGVVVQAVSYLVEILRRNTDYKPGKSGALDVSADFTIPKSCADIDITLSVSLWGVIRSGLHAAFAYLKRQNDNNIKNERK